MHCRRWCDESYQGIIASVWTINHLARDLLYCGSIIAQQSMKGENG